MYHVLNRSAAGLPLFRKGPNWRSFAHVSPGTDPTAASSGKPTWPARLAFPIRSATKAGPRGKGAMRTKTTSCVPLLALGRLPPAQAVYGQTAYGLADDQAMPIQRPQALLDAHAEAYPGVAAWIATVHQQAANTGEVRTLYGRRRYLPNIYSTLAGDVAEARRHAVNTIIQGTAADLLKLALIRLHADLPNEVRMLLPVHDSLLCEVPQALVEETREIVRDAMETLPDGFSVPLKVEVKTGRSRAMLRAGCCCEIHPRTARLHPWRW